MNVAPAFFECGIKLSLNLQLVCWYEVCAFLLSFREISHHNVPGEKRNMSWKETKIPLPILLPGNILNKR